MKPSSTKESSPVLPGIKPVLELLESHPERVDTLYIKKGLRSSEVTRIFDLCRAADIRFSLVEGRVLDRMCSAQHQGVIARLGALMRTSLPELLAATPTAHLPLIVALDQVQDPGNVGTLARTLYALGGAGLLLPKHNSAYLGDAARKASAGALDELPIVHATNLGHALDEAEETGLTIIGTGLGQKSAENILNAFKNDVPLPAVLVLGNEGKGLRPGIAKRCSHMLHIPMHRTFNSLNVAQAAAILLGLISRQTMQN